MSAATFSAENAVVLESFEQNIDAVALGDWGGGRIPDGVSLKQYTKSGTDDPNVTHGSKSLQVNLSMAEWWVHDFKITLSEDASNKIRQAARSTDVARYIFRYDIIFPTGTSWMNNAVYFGSNNDQLESNNGKRTMSLALDLVTGFPEEGQIVIRFADNFDATEDPFVGPLTIYVDNFRLIDTGNVAVTASAPKITSLQYNAGTRTITLKWDSAAGKTYAVDYTQTLGSWPTVMSSGVQGVQGTTTYTGTVPSAASGFFRVRQTH